MDSSIFWLLTLIGALLGASLGSFIEACVSRKANSLNELLVPSRCDTCQVSIRWYQNIPVISWPLLRGKCAGCSSKIPIRTWLAEVWCASGAAAITMVSIHNAALSLDLLLNWATLLGLFFVSSAIALWDWRYSRIPNFLVLSGLIVVYPSLIARGTLTGNFEPFYFAVVGSVTYCAVLWFVRLAKPGGMGLGDVKLAVLMGAAAGSWSLGNLAVAFFLAFLTGAVFGVALIASGKASRQSKIPFGPWMVIGLWLSFFFGYEIWNLYLKVIASVV